MPKQNSWFTLREGQIIKEAREKKCVTQEALAEYLDIDTKTVGNWERGLTSPGWRARQNLAIYLSIPFEQLGLATQTNFTLLDAQQRLNDAKSFFDNGAFTNAWGICSTLVSNLRRQVQNEENHLIVPFVHALYFAGHATSIVDNDAQAASAFFQEMGKWADQLGDRNWLCLARTYEGEMHRRLRKVASAVALLESAPQGPDVDVLIRGNLAQLLGRAYIKAGRKEEAIEKMRRAEELAFRGNERVSDVYICFNPCSVYEEYARLYIYDDLKESQRYIDLAAVHAPSAPRWRVPLLRTRGEMLIHSVMVTEVREPRLVLQVDDYQTGKQLVLEAAELSKQFGHKRQMWHAYHLVKKLQREQNRLGYAAQDLAESIDALNMLHFDEEY